MSMGVMAITGLFMNAVIASCYGSDILGLFNETYAWYMILAQISVWGIHMAIVKYVPEEKTEYEKGGLLINGIVVCVVVSLIVTFVSEMILFYVEDFGLKHLMSIVFSGFVLLSVNKVLLSYLNAIYKMVPYAIFSSLRYFCLGLLLAVFSFFHVDISILATAFPASEVLLFICIIVYFIHNVKFNGKVDWIEAQKLLIFGTKILPSYMVTEMNTKVDVVCLGFLISDTSKIGIYSFAILFTEGFYMLYITIRKIINPSLSEANANNMIIEHVYTIKKRIKAYLCYGGIIGYIALVVGYRMVCFFLGGNEYLTGTVYIMIIAAAIVVNGKSIVFGDLLAQAGFPFEESVLNVLTVMTNFALNVVLIRFYGVIGAAIATALSYFIFSCYLWGRVRKRTGIVL